MYPVQPLLHLGPCLADALRLRLNRLGAAVGLQPRYRRCGPSPFHRPPPPAQPWPAFPRSPSAGPRYRPTAASPLPALPPAGRSPACAPPPPCGRRPPRRAWSSFSLASVWAWAAGDLLRLGLPWPPRLPPAPAGRLPALRCSWVRRLNIIQHILLLKPTKGGRAELKFGVAHTAHPFLQNQSYFVTIPAITQAPPRP